MSFSRSAEVIVIPDLISHCVFKQRVSRHHKRVTTETAQWFFEGNNVTGKARDSFHGLKSGLLTAMAYPDAAFPQLRVCNDFITYLFYLDDISDDMDNHGTRTVADVVLNSLDDPHAYGCPERVGTMTKDFYKRMILTASPGTQQRFIKTLGSFFRSVTQQAKDRGAGRIPDLESYIVLRRDTSSCKSCWTLIEYAYNLDIPNEVMEHPLIMSLGEAANDLVTWSNDIFSYNVEQSKGDTHNMIAVVMNEQGIDLQSAVDFVGAMCKQSIDRFMEDSAHIPAWGPKIDDDVNTYVNGLADWMIGSLRWSFESERYFGKIGREVKATRVLKVVPRHK